jgi:hypothetical protein
LFLGSINEQEQRLVSSELAFNVSDWSNMSTRGRQTGAICLLVDVRLEQYVYPWTSDWSNMSTRGRQTGAICLPVDVRLEQYVYPWTSDWSNMSTRGLLLQWGSERDSIIKLEKKYAPALDNYGQRCFVRSYFFKMKCVCKTQMMPPPDHNKEMKANNLSFCEYLTKIPSPDFLSQGHKVQLPVIIKYLMKIKILWTCRPPLCA